MTQDHVYQLALLLTPQIGKNTARKLLIHFGSGEAVYSANRKALSSVDGIKSNAIKNIGTVDSLNKAKEEFKKIQEKGINSCSILDSDYPYRLKNIPDAPVLFFYRGYNIFNKRKYVAVVGTRSPTENGKILCEKLISDLSAYDPVIVSGLAYGIDHCAHKAAMKNGLSTLAVLGNGLKSIYPAAHRDTAREMCEHGGVISEFLYDKGPDRENFPQRNRIVAGMCDVIVVVESASKGGSIITAQLGNQYHRDVFAFPGRVTDEKSSGCNDLIKQHKAHLISDATDIIKLVNWQKPENKSHVQKSLFTELNAEETRIVEIISLKRELGIEQLAIESKMSHSALSPILLNLEFQGMIRALPGSRYMYIN